MIVCVLILTSSRPGMLHPRLPDLTITAACLGDAGAPRFCFGLRARLLGGNQSCGLPAANRSDAPYLRVRERERARERA